ncbi:tetratricopeptide repeat protein [Allomuricauda sp. d1]|uniref:tetratricopeptide repeat protein n=1 Tax=Allomuricauda sp. d1 TaxID=3136725 RepID=UPI0031D8964A
MKKILSVLILLVLCQLSAQEKPSVEEWQDDIRFLQKTVHQKYPFLFKKITAEAFDKKIDAFYGAVPDLEAHEIVVGFSKIIALFKYGHTRMSFRDSPVPFHSLPLDLYRFKDGLYIKAAHQEYKELIGATVVAIENKPIEQVLKAVYPTVPAENSMFYDAYGLDHLMIPEILHAQGITTSLNTKITLTLKKEDGTFDYTVDAIKNLDIPLKYGEIRPDSDWTNGRDTTQTPYYLRHFDKVYYFEYLADAKTVYVRHSRIRNDDHENVTTFYNRLFDFIDANEVEKLILDVRLNGGGNNYLNKPIITGIIGNEKINQPGKFFVITGRRTFSACQNLINELDNYTNVLFVGEPSSENINFYGDNKRVTLPNSKLPVYLSFAWWQDKPQWENADYITPHYPVEMTYQDYVANQDPVLDVALNFKSKAFILDPMEYLAQLFEEGKYDLIASEAKRMVNDSGYNFFDFETQFNRVGQMLLGNNNEGALFVLGMNAELFPESLNAWYNLAQAYLEVGEINKATKNYQKVIQLDPKSTAATSARSKLEKIQKRD